MSRNERSRVYLVVIVTIGLIALILLSSFPGSPLNQLTSPFSIVLEPVQKVVLNFANGVQTGAMSIFKGVQIRRENEQLLLENAKLRNEVAQLAAAGRQYDELKSALKLKDTYDRYEIIGGRLMTREIGEWFDVFRIDIGSQDGLKVTETLSYAVVDAQSRLVGRVLSTDMTSAKILPVLHEGFSVSGKLNSVNGALLRVRGDYDLKNDGYCIVDQIPMTASLHEGDVIVSSGLGGLFPAGIEIGKIIEIRNASSLLNRQAVLQPSVDLQNVSVVFVMKGQ
ncbi:MAG: rod shape-determining protein MreC [Eubacteriales bacterium]|nr:rod shape-determining protein MreC [Eubacteriales bacterium]